MKHLIAASFAAILIAIITTNAMASAEIVKQRAKEQRDLNNQQQGVVPATPAAPAPSTPAAPAPPQGISAAQQSLLTHVQTDFTAIKPGATVTADQKNHLVDDLALLGKGTVKPSKQALTKLASDLTAAFAEKTLPAKDMTQLVKNINIVANCGFLTAPQAQTFIAEAQTILKNAGVSAPVTQAVGTDLKAIVTEIQRSKPSLYQ